MGRGVGGCGLNYEPLQSVQLANVFPNKVSSKRVIFSLWFIINCTPRHCGVEEAPGERGGEVYS